MSDIRFEEMLINNLKEELKEVKQQLAEEEEKIERYKHIVYMNMSTQEMLELKVATQNQDKLSFAVEQLEYLKEKVNNAKIHKINMINTHELYEILDNQIKQLKEGK